MPYVITEADIQAEAVAKVAWEAALTDQFDTIEWYDQWFAVNTMDTGTPETRKLYYTGLMEWINEWAQERAEHGNDVSWLDVMREQYQQALEDTAEFLQGCAEERTAKTAYAGTGHVMGEWLLGDHTSPLPGNVATYAFC